MTAISAAQEVKGRDGLLVDHPVLADQIIYKGTPVFLEASSGYAQTNDGSTITLATGDVFAGIADETVNATGDSSGDEKVKCQTQGVFEFTIAGTVSQAKVGDPVYVNNTSDNSTLTLTAANDGSDCVVGYLVGYVSATKGLVAISGAGRNKVGYNPDPAATGTFGNSMTVAKATYSFAVNGGAVSTIDLGVTIPSGAIVYQALIDVRTALTSGGAADVGLTLLTEDDLLADTDYDGAPWSTTGIKACIPVGTAASAIKLTSDKNVSVEVEDAALTAGIFDVYVLYIL